MEKPIVQCSSCKQKEKTIEIQEETIDKLMDELEYYRRLALWKIDSK